MPGVWNIRRGGHGWRAVVVAVLLAMPSLEAADHLHVVKRNETLTGIAERHGLRVSELAGRNRLATTARLRVGQKLWIPGGGEAEGLNRSVAAAIESARVRPGRWKFVVIHHSAVPSGTPAAMDRYHRQRGMENGLAYHFVIGNGRGMGDGEIAVGGRWRRQLDGGHVASEAQNRVSLGICLVGNFDKTKPTARQMESLALLVEALARKCGLDERAVRTHRDVHVAHTRCPGRNFPARSFLDQMRARLADGSPAKGRPAGLTKSDGGRPGEPRS